MTIRTARTPELSDESLYQGLLNSDTTSFEILYKKFYPAVRQQVTAYGGTEDDAKDIFQDGIIALWKNARCGTFQLREGVKLSTYLIQVCKLRWIDRMKKASHRYEMRKEELPESQQEPEFLIEWIDREEQNQFQQYFSRLGTRCQELLKKFYFHKESLQQIALAMNVGEATAKNEKYRCMQRLKKIIQQQA